MPIEALVKPRSIAIVGATDRASPARSVIESLGALGFAGAIYPVNPKYPTVLNHVCYPTLTDLPEAPDVVVFSIRNPLIPEQMRLAIARGARAAVIYDSGFAELGEDGARLQNEIAGLCREAGMAMCGPNCMGILNPPSRVTTYKQTIMNPAPLAGNVGIVSQSGSVVIAMLSDLRRFGISLSVSAGNEAVTRTVDYIDWLSRCASPSATSRRSTAPPTPASRWWRSKSAAPSAPSAPSPAIPAGSPAPRACSPRCCARIAPSRSRTSTR
jgi:acyl-CoA synthetase (NDP forming)